MQAAAAPQAKAPSAQERFNQATEAMVAGKCDEAVPAFLALERAAGKQRKEALAMIRLRRGICQIDLGQRTEGKAAIESGIAVIEKSQGDFALDLRDARLALGRLAMSGYDYGEAEAQFRRALDLSTGDNRMEPLVLLARVTMFDPGGQALAYADEARGFFKTDTAKEKEAMGSLRALRARILLNRGDHKPAYDELKEALKLQGGLSLKVSLADIVTRSDLGIAALLNGDRDDARKYLAYSGAGRTEESPFEAAASMTLPMCGGEVGLRPDDRTVVEFRLGEDGVVRDAHPVYSTGGREAAVEFARAVSTWSWKPEDAAKIPVLFRYATRVELRCSTVGERPDLTSVLEEDFGAWLSAKGLPRFEGAESEARALPLARAAVAAGAARKDDPARMAALAALAANRAGSHDERSAASAEAMRLAAAAGAPGAVRAYLALSGPGEATWDPRATYQRMRGLLADPQIGGDPRGGGALRILIAQREASAEAQALIAAVAGDSRLTADDPVRVAALLEQSSLAVRTGDIETARAAFEKTGLTEQQCALVALQPAVKRSGASDADFPMEAMQWGFEGWVRSEFDVMADGKTVNQRAVIAYPPFVFNDAATGVAKSMRYQASYRPSGGAACSGSQQQIKFKISR
jgi:tetratricopeptide (TPR) repeat protein